MRRTLLATAAAVGLALPHAAEAAFKVESFNSISETTNFNGSLFNGSATVSRGPGGEGSNLGIYDTTNPAGADRDLGPFTPPGPNFGKALILQSNNTVPDDSGNGGVFLFDFTNLALDLHGMTFLDIEVGETILFKDTGASGSTIARFNGTGSDADDNGPAQTNAIVTFDFQNGLINGLTVDSTEIGSNDFINTLAFSGLREFAVDLRTGGTSTAIAEISAVPLPGAVVLFASGAALVGYVSRRSRRREVGTAA